MKYSNEELEKAVKLCTTWEQVCVMVGALRIKSSMRNKLEDILLYITLIAMAVGVAIVIGEYLVW